MLGNFFSAKRVGAHWVCEDLAQGFENHGWSVRRVSCYSNRVLRLLEMVWAVLWFRRAYDVAQVDVYSGRAFRLAEWVCCVLRWVGKPYVLTLHGGLLPQFLNGREDRARALFTSARAVTGPSEWMCRAMRAYDERIRFVPNPVLEFAERPRERIQAKILWMRAFEDFYQPELAVRVVARVRDAFPDVTLTMVGRDKGDGALERTRMLIEGLGMEGCVVVIPGVAKEEVSKLLAASDIFLNTSRVDNAPVSLVEAFASENCVVTTNPGGIPDLVKHNENGLVVEVGDEVGLADSIIKLIREPEWACGLARLGRERVESHSLPQVVAMWERIFENVVRNEGVNDGPVES